MGEFLFIIPNDWVQVPNEVFSSIDVNRVLYLISMFSFVELTEMLREYNLFTLEQNVIDARIFNGEILAIKLDR